MLELDRRVRGGINLYLTVLDYLSSLIYSVDCSKPPHFSFRIETTYGLVDLKTTLEPPGCRIHRKPRETTT